MEQRRREEREGSVELDGELAARLDHEALELGRLADHDAFRAADRLEEPAHRVERVVQRALERVANVARGDPAPVVEAEVVAKLEVEAAPATFGADLGREPGDD